MMKNRDLIVQAVRSAIEPLEIRRLLASVVSTQFSSLGTDQHITVTVDQGVASQLNANDLKVSSLLTVPTSPPLAPVPLSYTTPPVGSTQATWNATAPLATGWYESYVRSTALEPDENDYEYTFSFLNADFNNDHVTDFNDFLTLQNNFGGNGKTFAEGDANYDHTVDFNDFLILQNSFGQSLPAIPTQAGGIVVGNTTSHTLDVAWTANTDTRDGFNIYRSDNGGASYSLLKSLPDPEARAWKDDGSIPGFPLVDGNTYWYRVRAYTNAGGVSASISKASGVPTTLTPIPIGPKSVAAVGISSDAVLVSWVGSPFFTGTFKLERSTDPTFATNIVQVASGLNARTTSYTDAGLSASTQYYYRVSAVMTNPPPPPSIASAKTLPSGALPISISASAGGDGRADAAGGTAEGATGGDPMAMSYSGGAVRYSDGREFFSTNDLDPSESGIVSGLTRTWSSDPIITQASTRFGLGDGWIISQVPTIVSPDGDTDTLAIVHGGEAVQWFDKSDGAWVPRYFNKDSLVESGSAFTLTDSAGNISVFNTDGRISSWTDVGGNVTSYDYTGTAYSPDTITRYRGNKTTGTALEKLLFGYSAGKLLSVEMDRLPQGGSTLTPVRTVTYGFPANATNSTPVTTATVSRPGNVIVDRKYYRYDANGRLMVVLEGASYERALRTLTDIAGATSDALQNFANYFFDISSEGKLVKQLIQGLGVYQYSYGTSTQASSNLNSWSSQTTEYLPDPSLSLSQQWSDSVLTNNDRNVVYSNLAGEVLAKTFVDQSGSSGLSWTRAYQYDPAGQLTLAAEPSAVSAAPNPSNTNVVNGDIVSPILRQNAGLIYTNTYNLVSAVVAPGYLSSTAVKNGTQGTPVKQSEFDYVSQPNSPGWLIKSSTEYRSAHDPAKTSFDYGFYSGTGQVQTITTTLPDITSDQNGNNTATSHTQQQTYLDSFGRPVWTKDGEGYVNFVDYDDATGAVTETVVDADPSDPAITSIAALAGPARSGAGTPLSLMTMTTVDQLGRALTVLNPKSQLTSIAYVDTAAYKTVTTTPPATTVAGSGSLTPTTIVREQRANAQYANGAIETIRTTAAGAISGLSVSVLDNQGRIVYADRYENVDDVSYSASTGATGGTAYYRDAFTYDGRGRKTVVAKGRDLGGTAPTVTQTDFDSLNRPIASWIGTDITSGMTKVSSTEYDKGAVGDGNVTKQISYVDASGGQRIAETVYDWRDRPVLSESGLGTASGVSPQSHPPISETTYNDLNEPTGVKIYDARSGNSVIDILSATGLKDLSNIDGILHSQLKASNSVQYDKLGRVYRSLQHDINQNSGADQGSLATDTWYDHRGNVMATRAPGGIVTKTIFDGAGRAIEKAATDGGVANNTPDTSWGAMRSWDNDVVVEQTSTTYDKQGLPVLVVTRQHADIEVDPSLTTGSLAGQSSTVTRNSYQGYQYDDADRLIKSVNFGTNGGTAPSFNNGLPVLPDRLSTPKNGWDEFLTTKYAYDDAGRQQTITDPRGIQTRYAYDALDRKIIKYDAYTNGTPAADHDHKTTWKYNGADSVTQIEQDVGLQKPKQRTTYDYGVTKGSGFEINNSMLLHSVSYSAVTKAPQNLGTDGITYTGYNAMGEVTSSIQRNGSTHVYKYDTLGRMAVETASTTASTMDTTDGQHAYTFDALGRGILFTTYGLGGESELRNQVKRVYDGLGNMVDEYQAANGAVDTATTPDVHYVYDTSYSTNGSNRSRLSQTVYPDGRVLWTKYDGYSALDDAISRADALSDSDYDGSGLPTGPAVDGTVETDSYLGLDTVVERSTVDDDFGVSVRTNDLVYLPEKPGDAGADDQYGGLDRFGRIVSYSWGALAHRIYAYDADSNMLYSSVSNFGNNIGGPTAATRWQSDLYANDGQPLGQAYDQLNRIQNYQRGVLTRTVGSSTDSYTSDQTTFSGVQAFFRNQTWNASSPDYNYTQKSAAGDDPYQADAVVHNLFQRPVPTGTSDPISSVDTDGTGDGNNGAYDFFLKFDMWGRLTYKTTATRVLTGGSEETGYTYTYAPYTNNPIDTQNFMYDALGRRIAETESVIDSTSGTSFRQANFLYYDQKGNVIEERISDVPIGSNAVTTSNTTLYNQYVWSNAGPNLLAVQDTATGGGVNEYGKPGSGLDKRLVVAQGPDASTWETLDNDNRGSAVEIYAYTPSGQITVQRKNGSSPFTSPNVQGDVSTFGFRYLWHGGRAEMSYVNELATGPANRLDGFISIHGQEINTGTGLPVSEDVYAYKRGNSQSFPWADVNTNYPGNGTQPHWSEPSKGGDEFPWWTTFTKELPGAVATTTVNNASAVWGGVKEFGYALADIYNDANYVSSFASQYVMNGFDASKVQDYRLYRGSLSAMGKSVESHTLNGMAVLESVGNAMSLGSYDIIKASVQLGIGSIGWDEWGGRMAVGGTSMILAGLTMPAEANVNIGRLLALDSRATIGVLGDGLAAQAVPRILTAEQLANLTRALQEKSPGASVGYFNTTGKSYAGLQNGVARVSFATADDAVSAGLGFEEFQHAFDAVADPIEFVRHTKLNPYDNFAYHAEVFDRVAANPIYDIAGMTAAERDAFAALASDLRMRAIRR